jgi:protein SDA1
LVWSQRYIRPNYENITKVLALVASAVHRFTSPDSLTVLIRLIADRFFIESNDEEVIVVGLNTFREICARNPHGMTDTFLKEITQEKKSEKKGVVIAVRGIINLFREINPKLLPKKDRGRRKPKPKEDQNMESEEEKDEQEESEVEHSTIFGEIPEGEIVEVDEKDLESSVKIHTLTKEEKVQSALEGKNDYKHRNWKEGKTGGFSEKDKKKFKNFFLSRLSAMGKN